MVKEKNIKVVYGNSLCKSIGGLTPTKPPLLNQKGKKDKPIGEGIKMESKKRNTKGHLLRIESHNNLFNYQYFIRCDMRQAKDRRYQYRY